VGTPHSIGALFHAIRGACAVRFSERNFTTKMQADKNLFAYKHLKNTSLELSKVARSLRIGIRVA
jgi:hypothetical protein